MRRMKWMIPALLMLMGLFQGTKAQTMDSLALLDIGQMVRLQTFGSKKALVLVFTGNHCVYSKKYEDRLIRIANEFMAKDIAFVLVNSNDPELSQDDRWALMRDRAREKSYPCSYLYDDKAVLAKLVGATKNPEVFVFRKGEKGWEVLYSGKIDDNPLIEERVQRQFLVEQLNKIVGGDYKPGTSEPAVGCNIKVK
jgi:thiol-disulfide isomerase/thioredoxin